MLQVTLESFVPHWYQILASQSRHTKRFLLIAIDSFLFYVSAFSSWVLYAHALKSDWSQESGLVSISWLVVGKLLTFLLAGVYLPILRYVGFDVLWKIGKALALSLTASLIVQNLATLPIPIALLVTDTLLALFLTVGTRVGLRTLMNSLASFKLETSAERVIIYGAGSAGTILAQALANDSHYSPVAFVDDNDELCDRLIQGLRVYSPRSLAQLKIQKPFDTILLAIPSATPLTRQSITHFLKPLNVAIKTVPSLQDIVSGVAIHRLQPIDIADLLGRSEVPPSPELMQQTICGRSVLVTGAGGSIGSELCRQIAEHDPACLVLFELNEYALYQIDAELAEFYPHLPRVACLGSVTDADHLTATLKKYHVKTVYHAAAYKHVPLVEDNIARGIQNNVWGTLTAAQCAADCGIEHFVLISTDKAVRPTSVMGASKRVAELVVQALSDRFGETTCFTIVRFGNVLGSSGSVVPRFRQQIAAGGPITITHPEMTRYFMSIPEAARLVIQAAAMDQGGSVFLLDMGQPVRIYDLAIQMIRLSGLIPDVDIPIQVTGLRPGEKLYEELLIDSSKATPTEHPKIFSAYEAKLSWPILRARLNDLLSAIYENNADVIRSQLQRIVPEYQPARSPIPSGPEPAPSKLPLGPGRSRGQSTLLGAPIRSSIQ